MPTSTELRKLNNYPEFKTKEGINGVINYIVSKLKLDYDVLPPSVKSAKQIHRFKEKFDENFGVTTDGRLHYAPLLHEPTEKDKLGDVTKDYRVDLIVLPPEEREPSMKKMYEDPKVGLGTGIKGFYYTVCCHFLGITREEAEKFLLKQGNYQVGLSPKKGYNKPILAKVSNERWGADNIEFDHNYNILTVVDYFSKKVWARPIKLHGGEDNWGKRGWTASDNFKAFKSILEEAQTFPHIIQVDNGSQFKSEFRDGVAEINSKNPPQQKMKIIQTTSNNPTANGQVERMNREIRKKIRAGFIHFNNANHWEQHLQDYCENINSKRNSTTKFSPNELWHQGYEKPKSKLVDLDAKIDDHKNIHDIRESIQTNLYNKAKKQFQKGFGSKHAFKVGDLVRVKLDSFLYPTFFSSAVRSREKDKFERKKTTIKYSLLVYKIKKVIPAKYISPEQLALQENHIKNEDLSKLMEDQYTLDQMINGKWMPYLIKDYTDLTKKEKEGNKMRTPQIFHANDLIHVPEGSTDPTSIPYEIETIGRLNKYPKFPKTKAEQAAFVSPEPDEREPAPEPEYEALVAASNHAEPIPPLLKAKAKAKAKSKPAVVLREKSNRETKAVNKLDL